MNLTALILGIKVAIKNSPSLYTPIAQQVEHRPFKAGVPGSSPGGRTIAAEWMMRDKNIDHPLWVGEL